MDGRLIRPVRPEDAEAIYEIRQQPGVIAGTLHLPTERVGRTRKYIEEMGPDTHVLVAEIDGKVVGSGHMQVYGGKRRHVAGIGIMVHDCYWGRGVARALLCALLEVSDNHLGLRRVELEVLADNHRAVALYQSFGFQIEGKKAQDVLKEGAYVDVWLMARLRL